MSDLERLLADPETQRCLAALTGEPGTTLDDLAACYADCSDTSSASALAGLVVGLAARDGRINYADRPFWLEQFDRDPARMVQVLARCAPRHDVANANWWKFQGDALYAEAEQLLGLAEPPELTLPDDPQERAMAEQLDGYLGIAEPGDLDADLSPDEKQLAEQLDDYMGLRP